jgi:hypothetical protein
MSRPVPMDEERLEESLLEIVATLSKVADARQRGYALAERLNLLGADLIIDAIKIIRERALQGDEDCLRLYNALTVQGPLTETLDNDKLTQVADIAHQRGEFDVVAILRDIPSDREYDRPHQPFLDAGLKEIPIGARKSLARKPDFKLMQRIAKDQDHRVIEHLLNNPRMTESEVIKIGSTRPTSPKVLAVISQHRRWINRYRVKKTIVFNPYAPLSLALRLLTYLSVPDLELLCNMAEVNEVILAEAQKLLLKKSKGMQDDYILE